MLFSISVATTGILNVSLFTELLPRSSFILYNVDIFRFILAFGLGATAIESRLDTGLDWFVWNWSRAFRKKIIYELIL